jgi:hypothetical protein
LQGLRSADVVVLILGERYGAIQPSGLSATHEEYREAKDTKPLLVFVKEGAQIEEPQAALINEVQAWVGGNLRSGFTNPLELAGKVIRALHQLELATAVVPTDVSELKALAVAKLPSPSRSGISYVAGPSVNVGVAFGPRQQVLRPAQLEDPEFKEWLHQTVLFGAAKLLDSATGTNVVIRNDALVVEQERGGSVSLGETAEVLIRMPIEPAQGSRFSSISDSSVVIEEDVAAALQGGVQFIQTLLDRVDSTQRLTHVALAASISGAEHRAWRTRAEHAASPNAIEIPWRNSDETQFVVIDRKRGALQFDRQRLIEDIIIPLRRRWKK